MVELLAACDSTIQIIDDHGRTALHYAAILDNSKLITTLFVSSKANRSNVAPAKKEIVSIP